MKIVVDTNVLISAFLTVGTSQEVLDVITSKKECVISEFILQEFKRNLSSKKFDFPAPLIQAYIGHLKRYCRIEKEKRLDIEFSDPDDKKILALCKTVNADLLITGDKALLELGKIGKTKIIRPSQYWKESSK